MCRHFDELEEVDTPPCSVKLHHTPLQSGWNEMKCMYMTERLINKKVDTHNREVPGPQRGVDVRASPGPACGARRPHTVSHVPEKQTNTGRHDKDNVLRLIYCAPRRACKLMQLNAGVEQILDPLYRWENDESIQRHTGLVSG